MVQGGTGLAGNQTKPNQTNPKKGEAADNSDTSQTKAYLQLPVYLPGGKPPHNTCCNIREWFSEHTPEIRMGLEV